MCERWLEDPPPLGMSMLNGFFWWLPLAIIRAVLWQWVETSKEKKAYFLLIFSPFQKGEGGSNRNPKVLRYFPPPYLTLFWILNGGGGGAQWALALDGSAKKNSFGSLPKKSFFSGSNHKKKLFPFGHCPKVALTPPPSFGHLWGNFCLSRLGEKHTTKNYLKRT